MSRRLSEIVPIASRWNTACVVSRVGCHGMTVGHLQVIGLQSLAQV